MDKKQLALISDYQNENVISRFTDLFNVSEQEAKELFQETKKFLYLCQLPQIFIPDELLIIDEMWHNFILFTKDYQAFCDQYFGRYFHHLPASKLEKEQQLQKELLDPEASKTEFHEKLRNLISCTYDHLGQDTVIKWFKIFPVQYSKANISQLRVY